MTNDVQQQVTNSIIAAIEAGASGFEMPWHRGGAGSDARACFALPVNALTGKRYNGVNILMLWGASDAKGYASPKWATYKQWSELGAQVRKGEKGSLIVFWKPLAMTDRSNGAPILDARGRPKQVMFARASVGFNAAQVDNYDEPEAPVISAPIAAPAGGFEARADLEAFLRASGADIREGGDRAFYAPGPDFIAMPDRDRFTGTSTSTAQEAYYSTALHELTHWTGHKARLDRDMSGRFGDERYAGEELVAELGAAFLCAELGVSNAPRMDHAKYVASWLRALKNDKRCVFTAASAASKAVNYLTEAREPVAQAA